LLLLTIAFAVILSIVGYRAGSLMGGWSGGTFWDGGARIAYSFLVGMLIFRSQWIIKSKIGFIGLSILLFLAFIIPHTRWNGITEPAVVLFYFPLLISLGAGATLTKGLKNLCVFLERFLIPYT